MSVKDRKKWETILTKWTPFFIIACGLIGIVLGSFLAYFFRVNFHMMYLPVVWLQLSF
ncbi:hypothetical protein B4065_1420 [Caldibacillus thermoamylovorans]|uniref:hypothetical protein n=1 Tax=Caldibacillus thermoamylovorans TaxID=35841 RepID=UPI0005B6A4D1|nr:hypothetical protein [Caldibacillus thermoamylovorans]KIO69487.1 hypothetical protein B4065_1420 [Caldibacillus thermoamylovorans]